MPKFDVIVVGAGLIGAATALTLAKQDSALKVALVERAPESDFPAHINQRVVALGSVACAVLKRVGVFERLDESTAHAYTRMHVWEEHSEGELNFDAGELNVRELGYMVDAAACTYFLQKAATSGDYENLTTFFNSELQELDNSSEGVRLFGDFGRLDARLIIGADGGDSWVRRQAKLFAHAYSYQQQGIVANIKTALSHQNCAWQRFLDSGPVAVLPLKDNHASIVWSLPNALADAQMSLSDDEFKVCLASALDMRLGAVEELGPRYSFPLQSRRTEGYYSKSLALIGDAAHSIHPLAGQGANLGFKDIIAMAEMVDEARRAGYQTLGSLPDLQRYEQARKSDNEHTDALMTALNVAYNVDWPVWTQLRGFGMKWINSSKLVKAVLARQAME